MDESPTTPDVERINMHKNATIERIFENQNES